MVEGLKKGEGNVSEKVEPGDLYCLYSGSPVTVAPGKWTGVGLYMTEVKEVKRAASDHSGLKGTLRFKDEKVKRAYLYAYTSAEGLFRGPADLLQPVGDGSFSVRLPVGKYYIVARKRQRGGPYGPIETGDLFNFYPLNPLEIKTGEMVEVEIPLIERLSQLEEVEGAYQGTKLVVVDGVGNPLKGYYVLAYTHAARSGPPSSTAGPTGDDGVVHLNHGPEAIYLRARAQIGGPPTEEELMGDVTVEEKAGDELQIKVEKK